MTGLSKQILCTLGPASLNDAVIARLDELGVSLFRINLAHTKIEDLPRVIEYVGSRTRVPLCLDTVGAQVRTGELVGGQVELEEHDTVLIRSRPFLGSAKEFNLYPGEIVSSLEVGDFISIDFNAVLVQVIAKADEEATLRVLNGGVMGQNKAVTMHRQLALPPLTEKDKEGLAISAEMGIRHIALSFANRADDVDEIRAAFGKKAFVISKIECRNGLSNLEEIAARSDALLIDRGDLSREVPIEQIPVVQKWVIRRAREAGRPVYVATNLLETMVSDPTPSRAEVNDVYNTLLDGADGLVLAAETAIGRYPVACASMIVKLVHEYETRDRDRADYYPDDPKSLLVEPHGGRLVHREAQAADLADLDAHPTLAVPETVLMDCHQIAMGTYSPLAGFMTRAELEGVLNDHRVPDGSVWTLPVVLQFGKEEAKHLPSAGRVVLTDVSGQPQAFLDVTEVYTVDLEQVAGPWFGTASSDHPGVRRLMSGGDHFVAGGVTFIQRPTTSYAHFELTPVQTRFLFTHKGWSRVVGFHTRNIAHRVHEHIQLSALVSTHADGLYISPVLGPRKTGDFLPGPIMQSYQVLVESGVYPKGKVALGSFATYPRYCGPREAVFTALCRKNMGCSHFIIGRDHAGVGDFYGPESNRALFDRLGDIGVTPVFFEAIGYNPRSGDYEELDRKETLEPISGTLMREALRVNRPLPEWFMRPVVRDMLRAELAQGREVFAA